MRKRTIIACAAAVLLTIYALYAWNSIKGLNIYLLSYQTGRWLTRTWLPAAILAVAVWIFCIAWLSTDIRNRKAKKALTPETGKAPEKVRIPKKVPAPEASAGYCGTCGEKLQPGQKFCGKCGTKVG